MKCLAKEQSRTIPVPVLILMTITSLKKIQCTVESGFLELSFFFETLVNPNSFFFPQLNTVILYNFLEHYTYLSYVASLKIEVWRNLESSALAPCGIFQSSPSTADSVWFSLTDKYGNYLTKLYQYFLARSIYFVPSPAVQPHSLPTFPNNISNVSNRTTREIKHIVMTNTTKARFDLCETFARPVSFSAAFLPCFSCSGDWVSNEAGLSSSNVGFTM